MIWIAPSEKNQVKGTLENRLWDVADQLRANSGLTSARPPRPVATRCPLESGSDQTCHNRLIPFCDGYVFDGKVDDDGKVRWGAARY